MLGSSVAAVFHFLCSFFGSTTCWLSIFLSVTSIGLRHRCLVSSFVILVCPRDLETAQGSCVKVVLVDLREVVCIWVLGVHGVCCNMEVEGMNTFLFRRWLHPPFSRRFVWGNFHVVPQKCWYGVLGVMVVYLCIFVTIRQLRFDLGMVPRASGEVFGFGMMSRASVEIRILGGR